MVTLSWAAIITLRLRKQPSPISIRAPGASVSQQPGSSSVPAPIRSRPSSSASSTSPSTGWRMKKPPRAAWRSIRQRRSRRWLRSYQRRFAHHNRQPSTGRRLAGMADLRGGIDLGGTKIQTAIVDANGDVTGEARHPTPTEGGPEDVAAAMAAALCEAAADAEVETSELAGVGVGSPGDADEKTGVVSA